MELAEIFNNKIDKTYWILWEGKTFLVEKKIPKRAEANRETLARVYECCVDQVERQGATFDEASRFIRSLWIEESEPKRPKAIPRLIGEDGFLRLYALGRALSVELFHRIWKRIGESLKEKIIELHAISIHYNPQASQFYDVNATPLGFLSKLFTQQRLKKDGVLLAQVEHDLSLLTEIEDNKKRCGLALAILSHGGAYRELDGCLLKIPSFEHKQTLVSYHCSQHLIAEGVKTISLTPTDTSAPGIYLCQGTELWPSQPSVLGSILANLGPHGSATEAYAHSWRRIHKHLRDLDAKNQLKPLVVGHSMGGAMAIQIGLYSHDLIDKAYAFNPPVPHQRDYDFYHQMALPLQKNILVTANLDDFAFWRIGTKVIGQVTLFLGKKRWRYYPVSLWECLLIIPALVKFILNIRHAFPAHQNIMALYENSISVALTQEEIERENRERTIRFDNLHFFSKLYNPMKKFIRFIRKAFGWDLSQEYLRNEIEIIALHERDLIDTVSDKNREEIERELKELSVQKKKLQQQLHL